MCYHIVAACSICGARADWYTLIKPCNDRAQALGSANLALLDTFLRFYNTGELSHCPNDQLVYLRSAFEPAPPCTHQNCVPDPARVYQWTSTIPQFLEATRELFGYQDSNFSNPWTQEDRGMLLNAALGAELQLARTSFVNQTCGGDDHGLDGVQLSPISLDFGLDIVAQAVASIEQGLAGGLAPDADVSGDLGNQVVPPAAGQPAGDYQPVIADQLDPSATPKRTRSNTHWTDEEDEMLMNLHGQRDADGRKIWPYPRMIVRTLLGLFHFFVADCVIYKEIPCFHGRTRNALESRRLKLARMIKKKRTGLVNAGCNPGNNNNPGPNPDSDSGPGSGTGPGATPDLTLIAA
ncbi:hypothetical protein NEMBOFW57_002806 [Staphylotrichum longicolle]|uniref:Uncharacterized protein n=1 Tax=Staphylotrichum longicolle TaxID=669026 RepID=A0AAD4F4G7_9PEZI|nr:hypothetical protein NEMBOFW57_002806 [Staphylotrichum longicolle]